MASPRVLFWSVVVGSLVLVLSPPCLLYWAAGLVQTACGDLPLFTNSRINITVECEAHWGPLINHGLLPVLFAVQFMVICCIGALVFVLHMFNAFAVDLTQSPDKPVISSNYLRYWRHAVIYNLGWCVILLLAIFNLAYL